MNKDFSQWRYYNHAITPNGSPDKKVNTDVLKDKAIWSSFKEGTPLLARWTSDFDCGYETNWWYCIKDEPFDISKLNSNYRYKINKGCKLFNVKKINPVEYIDDLYEVQKEAYSVYPLKYRPNVDKESFKEDCLKWNNYYRVFGAFFKENNKLCGYALINEYDNYVSLSVQKAMPDYEKYQINAAIVMKILEEYKEKINKDFYILDGARNILHETNFQNYLEKYFGFRKAYCKLNIVYNPKIKWIVKLIYPFRKIFYKFDNNKLFHNINGVMKMEEIIRDNK